MSSFDLINLMTSIQNLPLNFDVAFYNWLKILPPTISLFCLPIITHHISSLKFFCKIVSIFSIILILILIIILLIIFFNDVRNIKKIYYHGIEG